jgi:hypothetical protein
MRKKLREHEVETQEVANNADSEDIPNVNDYEFIETEDGGMEIMPKSNETNFNTNIRDHGVNLAELMDEYILNKIAGELTDAVEADDESRSGWKVKMAEGLKLLGLKIEDTSELPFKYASQVYSPVLLQALLEYMSVAKIECLPPSGPVKCNIYSDENEKVIERAKRKERFGNYYLVQEDKGFYPDTEQAIMWSGFYGSVFKKVFFDPISGKPISRYKEPENIIINDKASSLDSADRVTEVSYLSSFEVKVYQSKGLFRRDVDIASLTEADDEDQIHEQIRQIEGRDKSDTDYEHNDSYKFYNIHTKLDLAERGFDDPLARKGIPSPYVVIVDATSKQVVGLYRDWKEGSKNFKPKEHFIHYYFMPGFGLYGFGLVHIAGNNAKAATQLERQLINAGMLNNHPGGVIAGIVKAESSDIRVGPTEFKRIDIGGFDDINKVMMPLPYKEPSLVLKQLKDDLEKNVQDLNASATRVPEFNGNAPVGTTYALLEETKRQQTSIIQRLHFALSAEFTLLFDLFGEYMPDSKYPFHMEGAEHVVFAEDFKNNDDIVPVSDPNIISSAQRLVREEIILKTAAEHSDQVNMHYALERYFRSLKLDSSTIDKLLPKQEEVQPLDPVTENQNAMVGKPIKAGIWQDHNAHITVHNAQMLILQQAPEPDQNAIGILQAHIKEHEAFSYQIQMQKIMKIKLPDETAELPPEMQNEIAVKAAKAAEKMLKAQADQQTAQQPIDPTQVMFEDLQIKRESNMIRQQENAEKMQLEQKAKQDQNSSQTKLMIEQMQEAFKQQMEQMRNELEQIKLQTQTQVDLEKAHLQANTDIELKQMDLAQQTQDSMDQHQEPDMGQNVN